MNANKGLTRVDAIITVACVALVLAQAAVLNAGGRERSKKEVCLANLRALAAAWQTYSNDNSGKIPVGDVGYSWTFPASSGGPQLAWVEWPHHIPHPMPPTSTTNGINGPGAYTYAGLSGLPNEVWYHAMEEGTMWKYVGDYNIYRCSSAGKDQYVTYSMSQSMNTWCNYNPPQGPAGPGSISRMITNINQIIKPAERFVFLDVGVIKTGAFFVQYDGSGQGKWYDLPPMIHSQGTNFVFADGHTEYRKWIDPHTLQAASGSWGGGTVDYCDCDLRWMTKITWGDVPYSCTNPDKHCEY
jgi:prepilin-type processing-associated H-X9-DG protein